MANDDEDKEHKGSYLDRREEFPGWRRDMKMLALSYGDIHGVFTDLGNNPNVGYQAVGANLNVAQRAKKQTEWNELARKLVGKVARKISNQALMSVFTEAYEAADVIPVAGQPDQRPYVFAIAMRALEEDCARASETGKQIARNEFKMALKSFMEKSTNGKGESSDDKTGFVAYADSIRMAEEKLRIYGVDMSDDEKKSQFYSYFNVHSSHNTWDTLLTVWRQSGITFEQIMQNGITEQRNMDLKTAEHEASGMRAFAAYYDDGPPDKRHRGGGRGKGAHLPSQEAYAGYARGGKGRKGKGGYRGAKGGKGGGRGGGRGGSRGNGGRFEGHCWTCGKFGHRSEDCHSGAKGKGHGKGSGKGGGKGSGKRKRDDDVVIPGCIALLDTTSSMLLEYLIVCVVMLLVGLFCLWSSASVIASSRLIVPTFVAPIMIYGSSKVINQYDAESERFTIKVNSALAGRSCVSVGKAILDTGAALHILNSKRHMKDISANNSYSVLGVTGKDNATACNLTGHVDMSFHGVRWDGGGDCIVTLRGDVEDETNALYCPVSPLNLVSASELLDAGWLYFADLSGMYHPQYRVSIYIERVDGLSYMPLVSKDMSIDDGDDDLPSETLAQIAMRCVGTFLSSMTKFYVTFGGPDVTRLRKTGEIIGLKLEGDVPPSIREFQMAKMRRSYPNSHKESMTTYKPFECVVWDMQGRFRTPSLGGCYYAHDAVDRATNLRFTYPVADASGETFVEVISHFLAFVGELPGEFVLKIARADMGSNYTSKHVRKFLERKGIRMQFAAVQTPHMIRRGELNHAIINATMRAIMSFANAPRETWALARKYACVLNNYLATKYNTPEVFVPWYQIPGMTLDVDALLPFGCLVIAHKAKEQVEDGYCDQRGVAGAFVGWSLHDGIKAITVLLPGNKIEHTVFYKADPSYYPWRPDGQRRLLNDGTFGDEGETARVFADIPKAFKWSELLKAFDDDDDTVEVTDTLETVDDVEDDPASNAVGQESTTPSASKHVQNAQNRGKNARFNRGCEADIAGPWNSLSLKGLNINNIMEPKSIHKNAASAVQNGDDHAHGSSPAVHDGSGEHGGVGDDVGDAVGGDGDGAERQRERQSDRALVKDARVCFHFDQGKACGTYVGPSKRKQDKGQDLHRVRWDDGGNVLVNLSHERRFDGEDVATMHPGEWAIVGMATTETPQYLKHEGMVYACEAQLDELIFARDYNDISGLFVPVMAAKKTKVGENGPFTLKQVILKDDWPEYQKAAETELDTIEQNRTWDLVDEDEAYNQGAYVYDTRYVFTRKRDGKYKARLVLRGDQQVWSDWDDDDDDESFGVDNTPWHLEDSATEKIASYEPYLKHDDGCEVDATTEREPEVTTTGYMDEVRQPRCNWTESELKADKFDETISLEDRIESLKGSNVKYDEVTASHWVSRPHEREYLDQLPPKKISVEADDSLDEIRGMLSQAAAKTKVANTYRQLFSPVMTQTVMFVLLAVAVANEECIFVADIKGAFLYAMLLPEEMVYCRPPKGYENHPRFKGKIMRLRKALYGLAQAPRRWFEHMVSVLERHGLRRTVIDPCLFVMIAGSFIIKAGTHVDDFIFTTNDPHMFNEWFGEVRKELNISSINQLGMDGVDYMSLWITYNMARGYLLISQKGYIEKSLRMFGLDNMKSSATPMATGVKFTKADMPEHVDERRRDVYRRMLGVARWITRNSTPEATFAVSYLACFLENPSANMLKAAVQMFRYFKWTIENGVEGRCFRAPGPDGVSPQGFGRLRVARNQVYGYIDATFLSEERSLCRYGVSLFVNLCCVYELSRRMLDIALSSTESEYCATAMGTCDAYYVRMVLEAMNEPQHGPVHIAQDNKSCIQIAENPGRHHGRTKHMDARIRWIERETLTGRLSLVYVKTDFMVADINTKALLYARHARHASATKGRMFPEKEKRKRSKRKAGSEVTGEEEV